MVFRFPKLLWLHAGQGAGDRCETAQALAEGGSQAALEGVSHKSDVGGVVLDITSPEAAGEAANAIRECVGKNAPGAAIETKNMYQNHVEWPSSEST